MKSIRMCFAFFLIFLASCSNPTPEEIYESIKTGDSEFLEKSIKKGFDVNTYFDGVSSVSVALEYQQYEALDLLLEHGADLYLEYEPGYPLVFWLALKQQEEALRIFIENGFDVNFKSINPETTLMHIAINKLPISFIQYLISKGYDLELRNDEGFSALNFAILKKKTEIAILLIKSGSDCNYTGFDNATIWVDLAYYWQDRNLEVADLAINYGARIENYGSKNGLYAAVLEGKIDYLEWLLENGADPTVELPDGSLPIDYAWRYWGNPEGTPDRDKVKVSMNMEDLLIEYGSRRPIRQ